MIYRDLAIFLGFFVIVFVFMYMITFLDDRKKAKLKNAQEDTTANDDYGNAFVPYQCKQEDAVAVTSYEEYKSKYFPNSTQSQEITNEDAEKMREEFKKALDNSPKVWKTPIFDDALKPKKKSKKPSKSKKSKKKKK